MRSSAKHLALCSEPIEDLVGEAPVFVALLGDYHRWGRKLYILHNIPIKCAVADESVRLYTIYWSDSEVRHVRCGVYRCSNKDTKSYMQSKLIIETHQLSAPRPMSQ